ncbi:nucleoid-associated protein YejK [Vibrio harveyi]|uniref:nucleoid-associated protein YejK n=1 Tax=Vibrio harveyi TaxID=669 RepID=UPI002894A361|nr:nucleoid-associated protein YejK [Vibrio harveyi]
MSLVIKNVIIHEFQKDKDENLTLQLRTDCIAVDSVSSQNLVSELHRIFNSKQGKGFGRFKEESRFQGWLSEIRSAQLPFLEFSTQSAHALKEELSKYPFADEGFLVITEYRSLATEYLFIALLPNNNSLKVTDDLSVSATDYLDLAKADIAARIDLSTYETDKESNRYLSFIKGRVGRKVSDFFLDFLEAEIGLDTKVQNQMLMQAVEDFCTDGRLGKEEATNYKQQVADYCSGQIKAGDEIQVIALSEELPKLDSGSSFQEFIEGNGYELEKSFPADRTAVRKLTKYVGAGGGLNISFDSKLLGERVFYDPETDTLTLTPPPNLKDQLTRNRN